MSGEALLRLAVTDLQGDTLRFRYVGDAATPLGIAAIVSITPAGRESPRDAVALNLSDLDALATIAATAVAYQRAMNIAALEDGAP